MNAEHWKRVREVFLAALERAPEGRAAFVEEACADDHELLLEVRRLIGTGESGDFLEPPQPERLAESLRALSGPVPGSTLGGYRLGAVIGSGGMGVVFRAVQLDNGRPVAIKVLPTGLHLRPQAIERFKREARAAARLSHPNLVPVLDFGREEGCYFYAMELVDGPSLAELLVAQRAGQASLRGAAAPLDLSDPRTCVDVAALLADALEHAHANGVVHRDVKPHNVLIDRDGTPRLVDFGLARDVEASGITREGEVAGTPHYMSPEQARSQLDRIDHRTDVYSLGVVLYEMLTLRRPFEGGTTQEVYYKIAHSRSRPARAVRPSVPRPLSAVCDQAMRREREQRYASAADMARDLRRWAAGQPVLARPPALWTRLRERAAEPRALLRIGPAVLLAGLAVGWAWSETRGLLAERSRRPQVNLDLGELNGPVRVEVAYSRDVPGDFGPYVEALEVDGPSAELRVDPGTLRIRVLDGAGVSGEYSRRLETGARVEIDVRGVPDDDARMVAVPETRVQVPAGFLAARAVDLLVPPFRIDRDPVTNSEYARFVEATGHAPPRGWPRPDEPAPSPDWDDLPVNYVSSADARAYAEWAGKRLPTAWEWLAACGGGDATRTVASVLGDTEGLVTGAPRLAAGSVEEFVQSYLQHARPVRADGGDPQGPYGLQYLFGNVCCWTDSSRWHLNDSGQPTVDPLLRLSMGASWHFPTDSLLRAPLHHAIGFAALENMSPGNGIRCVESASP